MINQVTVVDTDAHSWFIHKERESILDYTDDLLGDAKDYFNKSPDEEVYQACVIDFENNKSVIYEFVRTVTMECTVY
jgi:hypothetical protein